LLAPYAEAMENVRHSVHLTPQDLIREPAVRCKDRQLVTATGCYRAVHVEGCVSSIWRKRHVGSRIAERQQGWTRVQQTSDRSRLSRVKALDEAPFLDMFAEQFSQDPSSMIEPLRRETNVVRTPLGAMAIQRDLVQRLFAEPRLRNALYDQAQVQGLTDGPFLELFSHSLVAKEGEEHLRLRRLVNRAFTPRAIDRYRASMREILTELLKPVLAVGRCDFVAEIGDHYPMRVMCELLGVRDEDQADFAAWNKALTWVVSLSLAEHLEEVEWGAAELTEYVRDLVADRRRNPRDDLVTALVRAEEDGDGLTDVEIRVMIATLLFGGFDTTRMQLGLAMAVFARHPDQWARLGDEPELIPRAVEELLRLHGSVARTVRIVVEDLDVDGYLVPEGTLLVLSLHSANADPCVRHAPLSFDITRAQESHLTFGGGAHYCLGANLARAELQEALRAFAPTMRNLALDGQVQWRSPFGIFGPERLPLRFSQSDR
jgi:cytochrome P450